MTRILGIDPGIVVTGYAVVEEKDRRPFLIASGEIKTSPASPFPQRLKKIHDRIRSLVEEFAPAAVAIEDSFIGMKNLKSALKLGQARGVALLAAGGDGLAVHEYTPLAVKVALVGYGGASKEQVKGMVTRLLARPAQPLSSHHVSDAVAVALCHLHSMRMREATGV